VRSNWQNTRSKFKVTAGGGNVKIVNIFAKCIDSYKTTTMSTPFPAASFVQYNMQRRNVYRKFYRKFFFISFIKLLFNVFEQPTETIRPLIHCAFFACHDNAGISGVARNLIWEVYVLTSHCNFKTCVINVPHVNKTVTEFGGYIYRYTTRRYAPGRYENIYNGCLTNALAEARGLYFSSFHKTLYRLHVQSP